MEQDESIEDGPRSSWPLGRDEDEKNLRTSTSYFKSSLGALVRVTTKVANPLMASHLIVIFQLYIFFSLIVSINLIGFSVSVVFSSSHLKDS